MCVCQCVDVCVYMPVCAYVLVCVCVCVCVSVFNVVCVSAFQCGPSMSCVVELNKYDPFFSWYHREWRLVRKSLVHCRATSHEPCY